MTVRSACIGNPAGDLRTFFIQFEYAVLGMVQFQAMAGAAKSVGQDNV